MVIGRNPLSFSAWILLGVLAAGVTAQAPSLHFVADLLTLPQDPDTNPSAGVPQKGWMLFFGRPDNTSAWAVYTTDGTLGGTKQLPGLSSIAASQPKAARVGDYVIFGLERPDGTSDVWTTDGTPAGSRRILPGFGVSLVPDRWHGGDWIVFGARRDSRTYLYQTDGSTCYPVPGAGSSPTHLTAVEWQGSSQTRHLTFYSAFGGWPNALGREPYVVEIRPSGAPDVRLVQDLMPGSVSGFTAPADSAGFAIWVEPATKDLYVATIGTDPSSGSEVRRLRRPFTATNFTLESSAEVAPGPAGASPRDLVARGNDVFFAATNAALGGELWRLSLATGQLTSFDLEPGPLGSAPQGLVALPSANGPLPDLWFHTEFSGPGRELWRHDGATTAMVFDANPGESSSRPQVLGHADGRVFFAAENPTSGRELWRSDGTPTGTSMAFDAVPGPDSSNPTACGVLTVAGATESLLYAANSPVGRELHRADATTAAPVLVRNFPTAPVSSHPRPLLARWADGRALFLAWGHSQISPGWGSSLWVADGRAGQATQLLPASTLLTQTSYPQAITFDDGTALILVNSEVYGSPRLFVTDGTMAGTSLAATVPLSGLQKPVAFRPIEFGDSVFFGTSETFGRADTIWRTTRTGSAPQAVLGAAQGICRMRWWTVVGDRIFMAGARLDGSSGNELWVWQPPAAPTQVAEILPGNIGSSPHDLVAFRNRCYFIANDGLGYEVWASNGLASGTFKVTNSGPGTDPRSLVDVGSALVFIGDDGVHGPEPWRSNGTQAGTAMIADLRPGPLGSSIGSITPVHVGVFACVADDGVHGRELWRIDTTTGAAVHDIRPGPGGSDPYGLTWSSRNLFFSANDGMHGREPWYASWVDFQSVAMVADLAPGTASSVWDSAHPIPAGRHVMFAADDQISGRGSELYAVDMTGASSPIGRSCVRPFQTLQLRSTAPRLGQGLTYWAFEPGATVPATTLMSLAPPTSGPMTMPNVSCPVWVDPTAAVIVDSFVTTGNFVRTVTVPGSLALLGTVARMQVLLDYPPQLATNGLELVIGN